MQIFCVFGANLMMVALGLSFSQSGYALPQLEDPKIGFSISKEDGSWFASILMIGCMIGATSGGIKCDFMGRRKSILVDSICYITINSMLSLSTNFTTLLAGRFLLGFVASSAVVSLLMYSGEITQPQVRQITGPFSGVLFALGTSLGLIFGAILPWRWAFAIGNLLPLSSFAIMLFAPESPVWYLTNHEEVLARKALEKLRGKINTDIIDAEVTRIKTNMAADYIGENDRSNLQNIHDNVRLIFKPSFYKPFLVIYLLYCNLDWGGIVPASFYIVPMLKDTQSPLDAYWIAPILGTTRMIFAMLSVLTSMKLKRRPTYFISASFMAFGTLLLSAYTYFEQSFVEYPVMKWIPVFAIFILQSACGYGTGTIPFTYLSELLPVHAKSLGNSLIGILAYFSLFWSVKTVPSLVHYLGLHGNFLLNCLSNVITIVICYFVMPETCGLTLEEIEDIYRPQRKKIFVQDNESEQENAPIIQSKT